MEIIGVVFVVFIVLMVIGVPVSYSLFGSSLIYLIVEGIPLSMAVQRIITGVNSFPLLAVPFFILAGNLMNVGGITEKIFRFSDVCVGHFRGGLAHVNVLGSVIFAGMSGSAVADAGGLGTIEIHSMTKAGYGLEFSTAITAASSLVGPIIPPSIVAVIYSVYSGASVGRLFMGGVVPGVFMALMLSAIIYFQCRKRNFPTRKRATLREFGKTALNTLPALFTSVILIGGTTLGIFTATEAAVVACVYALILGFATRQLKLKDLPGIFRETISVTGNVMMIIACSALFGWIVTHSGLANSLAELFHTYISERWVATLFMILILLIIGMFMDNSAAIPIFAPVLVPVAATYGIDAVHFGIIMILVLVLGLITPPVGMVLFTLSGTTKLSVGTIAKTSLPYIAGLIVVILLVSFIPEISMTLPNLIYGG